MQIIETSLYSTQRPARDLKELAAAQVVSVIEPMTYAGMPRRFAETYLDEFERLVEVEPRRCAEYGIEHLTLVGVPALDAAHQEAAHRALDRLGAYLGRPGVVGIGEVGFEHLTQEEESIFRRQARMARETGLPLVVQAPTNGNPMGVVMALQIINQEKVNPERVLIKGLNQHTLPLVLKAGAWAGLTVHPAFLNAEDAMRLIARYGTERILLQSDAGRGYGDHLAVPQLIRRLQSEGLPGNEVERLVFHNPKWFFSQGLGLSERRARELAASC